MKNITEYNFNGFSNETFKFLSDLRKNNNKKWFDKYKSIYINSILNPMKALVDELSFTMLDIDSLIEVEPSINKTISRIYNDRRFAVDKPPYKCAMWIKLQRQSKYWKTYPGFFFEITPEIYQYGMGFYQATTTLMSAFRDYIDKDTNKFLKIARSIKNSGIFDLKNERYSRIALKHSDEIINDWYNSKSFYLVCSSNIDKIVMSDKIADEIISGFNSLKPLYSYMWEIIKRSM